MELKTPFKMTRSSTCRQNASASASSRSLSGLLSRPGPFVVISLSLVVAVFAIYAPTLPFQFVIDDHFSLNDLRVTSPGHVSEYFANYTWSETAGGSASFYRPLLVLWMRINFILSGMSPWGWHLVSIARHLAAAALFGLLVWNILRDRLAALIAATLFALHPAQVESVAWVSVPDPLVCIGAMCAVLLYLRYTRGKPESQAPAKKSRKRDLQKDARKPSVVWLIGSAVVVFMTLLVKETAIILPIMISVLALFQSFREIPSNDSAKCKSADFGIRIAAAFRQIVTFLSVTMVYFLMRFHAMGGTLTSQTQHLPLRTVLLSWPATLWFYVKVLLWPIRSHAFADSVLAEEFSVHGVLLPGLGVGCAIAVLVGTLYWAWRKAGNDLPSEEAVGVKYALLLGVLLLVLPILLTLNLNALMPGDFLHGRYTYLSVAGLLLLAAAYWRLYRKYLRFLLFAAAAVGVAFAILTIQQEQQWRDDLTVLTVAHQLAPHNARVSPAFADARVHFALQLSADGRYNDALPVLEQIISEFPGDWFAWAAQADCLYHLNNLPEAEKSLRKAAELSHKPEIIQQWQELRAEIGLPSSASPE